MNQELKELQNNIPNTEIMQFSGAYGLWESGLFCKTTGLKLNWVRK